jgi:hypothetical protein
MVSVVGVLNDYFCEDLGENNLDSGRIIYRTTD